MSVCQSRGRPYWIFTEFLTWWQTHQETWGQALNYGVQLYHWTKQFSGFYNHRYFSSRCRRLSHVKNSNFTQTFLWPRQQGTQPIRQPWRMRHNTTARHCYTDITLIYFFPPFAFAFHNCNSNADELDINGWTCKHLLSKQRYGDVSRVLFLNKRTLFLQITILSKYVHKSHKHKIIWMSKQTVSSGALSGSRIIQ